MKQDLYGLKQIITVFLVLIGLSNANITMADGTEIYRSTCIACHGKGGQGVLPGVPNLTDSDGRLSKPENELFDNVVNGFQSPDSPMAMPPRGGNTDLSNEDVRRVLTYMKKEFMK